MPQLLRVATAVRRILQVVFVIVFLAGCTRAVSTVPAPTAGPYDVVIENGLLVNGTGNPWMYGNVGIRSDRIVAITPRGALHDATASQRVDARGHVVAPGFIDIQNHSWDAVLWRDGRVMSMITQGVTSVILGEATAPAPSNDKVETHQGSTR